MKTKLSNDASTFLADKNSYILGYLVPGLTRNLNIDYVAEDDE